MKSNIFIPEKINVGYQKRNETYTGELAYIIYWDETGKLRKETSWQSWRDDKIEPKEFENIPTSGFVLNKKSGGYSTGWNYRQTYVRVYDPRGFEFEIDVPNLLYILENTSSIKGKGLEGDFVYGWDGKNLVLIPCESPDYKELTEYNEKVQNAKKFKLKDMIVGATYLTKQNEEWIYMGRFDSWYFNYNDSEVKNKGKKYFFYKNDKYDGFETIKSLTNKIIDCIDENCVTNYAELMDKLECRVYYSPVDKSQDKKVFYDEDRLKNFFESRWWGRKFLFTHNDSNMDISVDFKYDSELDDVYQEHYSGAFYSHRREIIRNSFGTLTEFIEKYKPYYIKRYLKNGKFYKEVHKQWQTQMIKKLLN